MQCSAMHTFIVLNSFDEMSEALISPLFFAIMSSILNLVQTGSQGGGGSDTILLLVFLLIALPFAYVGFMLLVFYTKPLYSRLTTIKNN